MEHDNFVFEGYDFDATTSTASFRYLGGGLQFEEKTIFAPAGVDYDPERLDAALFLSFLLVGTSYYKCFPSPTVALNQSLDTWQAAFFDQVYQEGLSQFAYENQLTRMDLAHFVASSGAPKLSEQPLTAEHSYLSLQSGGKDSLLSGSLLSARKGVRSLTVTHTGTYPSVIDRLGAPLVIRRRLDRDTLGRAAATGGLNGHVPITYIVMSFAVIQAVLSGTDTIVTSVGHEGEEAHAWLGDLPVNHQWSKTWSAEQQFAEYLQRYVSSDLRVGSLLRPLSELKIAELFVARSWPNVGHEFSSCNRLNYGIETHNQQLRWCGECPKCANSYLLFAPFVDPDELKGLFAGQDLFDKPQLIETWKGLLGVDNVMKPFECVGEIAELRRVYHMAKDRWGDRLSDVPFAVPESDFDYQRRYPAQPWAIELLDGVLA